MNGFSTFVYNLQESSFGETVKSMFTLPTIGLPTAFSTGDASFMSKFEAVKSVLEPLGLVRGIPIYASSQEELGENNIGQQILIRSKEIGTQVVTDNISPLPRTWVIQGYIGKKLAGNEVAIPSHTSSIYALTFLQAIKDYFRYLRILRAPFRFITREGAIIDVLMQNYRFIDEPESEYATRIEMRLMEYVALSIDGNTYSILNTPGLGSAYGNTAKYASAFSKSIDSSLKDLMTFIGGL